MCFGAFGTVIIEVKSGCRVVTANDLVPSIRDSRAFRMSIYRYLSSLSIKVENLNFGSCVPCLVS